MMRTIEFNGKKYPFFQTQGNAAQFIIPFAKQVCKGVGVDVGCNRQEWSYPGSIMIDPTIDSRYHATNFPDNAQELDYIFSSHCLEHLDRWVSVLDYWISKLKKGGVVFLYLPDFSQNYWNPWHNRKHVSIFTPDVIRQYINDNTQLEDGFVSGVDLNNSFAAYAYKK